MSNLFYTYHSLIIYNYVHINNRSYKLRFKYYIGNNIYIIYMYIFLNLYTYLINILKYIYSRSEKRGKNIIVIYYRNEISTLYITFLSITINIWVTNYVNIKFNYLGTHF